MHPILFKFGFFQIYGYGLMVALAFWVSVSLLARRGYVLGLERDFFWNLSFWALTGGILGGRLMYILLNLDFFLKDPLEIFKLWHGGLVWYGGFIAGLLSAILYLKRNKAPILKTLDLAAPFIGLAHAIGRIGCFLNGCCYGRPVSWGIYFPEHNERLIPVQLISSIDLLVIFIILRFLEERPHRPGSIVVYYLLFSSLERFLAEFLRNDSTRNFFGLTIFQLISMLVFISAVILWFIILRFPRKT
ncbi:MAG: prolipoprotein diacylglyceryl transferase [Candidatus Omnitrophota bacterium]|nr:prolipoprotein diacylglyceryl transferase [Candidatus Omnitrophota bacterium]